MKMKIPPKITTRNLEALKKADVDQDTTKAVSEKSATGIANIDWTTNKGMESLKEAAVELNILGTNGEITNIDLSNMDAGKLKQLKSLASKLALGIREGKKDFTSLNSDFGKLVEQACNDGPVNINALVQQVLRESYQENTKDLGMHANKVKFFNECKKAVREHLSQAREVKAAHAGQKEATQLNPPFTKMNINTEFSGQTDGSAVLSGKQFETVDTVFTSADFVGDRAGAGSSVDPVAIRLGDGPAVIDTPNGSFVLEARSKKTMTFDISRSDNWKPGGGLDGVADRIMAMVNDNDPSNDKFVPQVWTDGAGNKKVGFWNGKDPKPDKDDIKAWLNQEINDGRITISDSCKKQWAKKPFKWSDQRVGFGSIKVEYTEEKATTQWFGKDMGILVHDMNKDGQITRDELFGDTEMTGRKNTDGSKIKTGYDDMARYDTNNDGKLTAADANFSELKIWRDLDSDGRVDPGELKTLAQWGITELSVKGKTASKADQAKGIKETSVASGVEIVSTLGQLDAYIEKLESRMNSVGDDAQLANVDLQNVLQKQQQNMQMMSNISKMLHDTAMAIVRKIG
jgi:hypothetical protein